MKAFAKLVGLFFLSTVLLFAVFAPKCDSGSKSVALARSLSQQRLGILFEQMKSLRREVLAKGDHVNSVKYISFGGASIPGQFLDLDPRIVRPCAYVPNIMLEGCFDEFVYLNFFGVGEDSSHRDHSPRIELRYANDEGPEVLWPQSDGNQIEQVVRPIR